MMRDRARPRARLRPVLDGLQAERDLPLHHRLHLAAESSHSGAASHTHCVRRTTTTTTTTTTTILTTKERY
jgi:hypothetical protein